MLKNLTLVVSILEQLGDDSSGQKMLKTAKIVAMVVVGHGLGGFDHGGHQDNHADDSSHCDLSEREHFCVVEENLTSQTEAKRS